MSLASLVALVSVVLLAHRLVSLAFSVSLVNNAFVLDTFVLILSDLTNFLSALLYRVPVDSLELPDFLVSRDTE